jgi:hypothetical protein
MRTGIVSASERSQPSRLRYRFFLASTLGVGLLWIVCALVLSRGVQAQTATGAKAQGQTNVSGKAGSDQNNKPGVPLATPSHTRTPTFTPTKTPTPTRTHTHVASPTPTSCPIQYTDVLPGSTFYTFVRCLACQGIVDGYNTSPPCTTGTPCFLPNANISRAQMAKFISNGAGYSDNIPATQQTFTDVPATNVLWIYIERLYVHGITNGYTTAPPCTTGTPCYLPNAKIQRGQTSKFVSNAAGYSDPIPPGQQTFTDVPSTNIFWIYVERAKLHGVIGGYNASPPCTTGTPCFLPNRKVTRGQATKFISNAFFPNCQYP